MRATSPLLLARGPLRAAAGDHRATVEDLLALAERCLDTGDDKRARSSRRSGSTTRRSLIYTIIEAPNYGWAAAHTIGGPAVAGGLLFAFIAWERRARAPMLEVGLFRNLRFSAASGAVTITFFSLMGFIFLVTLYMQVLKGYAPLSTGLRILPVATTVGITSVLGTSLAVRAGTKLVVAGGLVALAVGLIGFCEHEPPDDRLPDDPPGLRDRPHERAGDGVHHGRGLPGQGGVGSAINDATRILGATLGVAIIGSVYPSLYASRLTTALTVQLPDAVASGAHRSVGDAFAAAAQLDATGHTGLARTLRDAASTAFFAGFGAACLVAAGVAAVGAILAAMLIPAQPPVRIGEAGEGE